MLTIQTLADIAMRHATYVSAVMIVACVRRHHMTGEPLDLRARAARPGGMVAMAPDGITWDEWLHMVERNTDTRWQHV